MKIVLLAGGSGTRLWPISRQNYPKQFMDIEPKKSLIQKTAERFLEIVKPENILINTNNDYKFYTQNHLQKYQITKQILEPAKRNTAPAIALIIKYLEEKEGLNENEIILLSPTDHLITPIDKFAKIVKDSEKIAQNGNIVLFGINPTSPETGYGYIKVTDDKNQELGLKIKEFKEKPNLETAKKYLLDGHYFWNSGLFMFSLKTIKEEFTKNCPKISRFMQLPYDKFVANFDKLEDISIDYAIMEKTKKAKLVPMNLTWSDVGNWDSIYENTPKDNSGNSIKGNVILDNTSNSLIWTEKKNRLVAVSGLKDALIVDTHDALYITHRGSSIKTTNIINKLKKIKAKELKEHLTTYRPWWSYTILLEKDKNYKIKKITVNPGEKLSLQMHHHRSEHWTIVHGTAKVVCTKDQENLTSQFLTENESIYIPKTYIHRLSNPGKEVLEMIEVQVGSYLKEDDIVRFEDIYKRN